MTFDQLIPRDPARIRRITAKLLDLWERYPDQRFYQLLHNLTAGTIPADPYNVEDDVVEAMLDAALRED